MSVLLISTYELGHPPHGLALPRTFLTRAGIETVCVDLAVQPLTDEAIDAATTAVISVPMHTALNLGVRVARRIRSRNPSCRLIFTGLYAAMNEAYLRRELGADHVLAGEYEGELIEVLEGRVGERVVLDKLDFAPIDRSDLPGLERYARIVRGDGAAELAGYAETSRGCLDTCAHCPVPAVYRGRFFIIDRQVVLEDISAQVAAGARHITFGDPDFLNGPGHGFAILEELHCRWPSITFDITAQISHLLRHASTLPRLAELGCAFVVSAVESLSDDVLAALRKRHRRADVERALSVCRRANLPLRPTFVPFTPWTTLADLRELIDFITESQLIEQVAPVQLSIRLLVPPGSLLLDRPETHFGELDPGRFSYQWRHADPRVDRLQRQIAKVVELAATSGAADFETFVEIRRLIYAAEDARAPALGPPAGARAPRMSEPWFC